MGGEGDDAADLVAAWERAGRGEAPAEPRRVPAFESWEGLASVMTGERYRLLRRLNAQPEPTVGALARSLGRPYRRVHGDVAALEGAGLVARGAGGVRATADVLRAEIRL